MQQQQSALMEEIIRSNIDQGPLQLPGVRFCPMDDELVLSFLKPLLAGENVPGINHVVFDCDLYGSQEPWQIWDFYKDRRCQDLRKSKDLFFFTKLKRLSSTDKRINRTVGKGTWKGDKAGEAVNCVDTGREVGIKKRFTYKNQESAHNGCWTMYEYDLASSEIPCKKRKNKDCVLCLLRKTSEPKSVSSKRKQLAGKNKKKARGNKYNRDDDQEETSDEEEEEQEEVLEVEAKRQRTTEPSIDVVPFEGDAWAAKPPLDETPPPMEDDFFMSEAELDAFTVQLEEELLPTEEDGTTEPSIDVVPFEDDAWAAQPLEEIPPPMEDEFFMSEAELDAFTVQLEEELLPTEEDGTTEPSFDVFPFADEVLAAQPLEEIPLPVEDDFFMSEAELDAFTVQLEEELLPTEEDGYLIPGLAEVNDALFTAQPLEELGF